MKYISFILSILIFTLTIQPCSDSSSAEEIHLHESGIPHDHNKDSEDECSPFCYCNCCQTPVTFQSEILPALIYSPKELISTKVTTNYQSNYRFDFSICIWHPPKVIV